MGIARAQMNVISTCVSAVEYTVQYRTVLWVRYFSRVSYLLRTLRGTYSSNTRVLYWL